MRLSWKERPAALWKGALRLSTTARPHLRPVFILAGALCGSLYLILLALAPPEFVPQHFKFANSAAWITTNDRQQATGCFRLDLWVPGTVVNAWVALASNGGFEVLANGESCARDYSGSPISSYQEALSLSGQRLRTEQMAISVQIPREFQWAHHDTTLLPSWVDLTANLQQGHNTLCVEVETPGTTPAMILAGEVRLATGEVIPIASGQRWVAEPVPLSFHQENWTMPEWSVYAWSHARVLDWRRTFWRLVPKGVFEEPFHGKRIRFDSRDPTTWLEDSFNLADKPRRVFCG